MTFAIAGRCARTGMVGVAVTTSSICVGSRCPWVRAGVGAVSTQNVTLPSLGPSVLDALEAGASAMDALTGVMADEPDAAYRQLVVVDSAGAVAHFTGEKTLGTNQVATGQSCVAGGNLLSHEGIPQAMVDAFCKNADKHLAERLIMALEGGASAGGEEGPTRSAALLVADQQQWPLVDLRVDWDDDDPVVSLRTLWHAYEPEMNAYLTRALEPSSAPSYGVPGDE